MDPERCPMLYSCSKVKMTPLIRTLLRCTASEAMQSICKNCVDALDSLKKASEAPVHNIKDSTYVAPSGRKITVIVGDENRNQDYSVNDILQ